MAPYILFLIFTLFIGNLAFRGKTPNYGWLILLFFLMTLFAGLRSVEVGTDTWTYAIAFEDRWFENKNTHEAYSITRELGYDLLQRIVATFSTRYGDLLVIIAAIVSFLNLQGIRRLSPNPLMSLFFFITLGYYTYCFNAGRQSIAMAFYMIALSYLVQKRFWIYTLTVLLASTFHHSVLVAIPLYFVFLGKYSKANILLVLIGGFFLGVSAPYLIETASQYDSKLAGYKELSATGGYLLTTFYVALSLFFIYQRKWIIETAKYKYDIYLQMMIMSSVIYLVVAFMGLYVEFSRFAAYFQIASIFLWAEIKNHRTQPLSKEFFYGIFAAHVLFFLMYISVMANLVPYILNSQYTHDLFN